MDPVASAFRRNGVFLAILLFAACSRPAQQTAPLDRPSILLITLDTTRADAIGPDAKGVETRAFNTAIAKGRRFTQAYATVPETLPSHTSMMTGLYPGGHGIHQNARYIDPKTQVLAEQLQRAGYHTAAFVSAYVLNHRFGLARGFNVYDDEFGAGRNERNARETTVAALRELRKESSRPRFLWVHYYDPHAPYQAPDSSPGGTAWQRYLGEIRFMDTEMALLLNVFYATAGPPHAVVIVGDHGEGLGEHGEAEHGRLLYQATMHVPLVIAGPGVEAGGVTTAPVSTRRVYHTILDWAGLGSEHSLRGAAEDDAHVVLGEGMGPFLQNGWQPQVMGVSGRYKAILSGKLETYDLQADPQEAHDLGSGVALPPDARKAMEDYPVPSPDVARAPANLDEDAKRRLAALGYVSAGAAPAVRKDAPRPADMVKLFATMDDAAALFGAAQYAKAVPVLQKILAADPRNLDAALRLATSYSSIGRNTEAEEAFQRAAAIAPNSQDVRTYVALHYARTKDWARAVPLLEQVVKESPDRTTAVEALGGLKIREALAAMDRGDTPGGITAFERARQLQGAAFANDLELGVLYLDARRLEDARTALDRALAAKPDDPMTLFKRAQVSVLLQEPDRNARIAAARAKADGTTRALIERERLFR